MLLIRPRFSWLSIHSGGATYRSGCSQEHPDLKNFFFKKNLYLIHIRNTLNHKFRNTLELKKKKKLSVLLSSQKKKKPKKKFELKSKKKKKNLVTELSPLPTESQAQHNPEVANPWILTQKKEKPIQSKSEINPRSRRWQRKPNTVHTKQKQYRFVY